MIATSYLSEEFINAAGMAIFHSAWQFTLIALVMTFLLKYYQNGKANVRYIISLSSLLLSILIFGATFLFYYLEKNGTTSLVILSSHGHFETRNLVPSAWQTTITWLELHQKAIVITWLLGIGIFSLRLLGSWLYIEFLIKSKLPIVSLVQSNLISNLKAHFGIKQEINISESQHIQSPMLVGWLKTVILFPIGVINQLESEEIEAILAHELAHLVRKDIWINVAQTMIEALLYYHPAIWWISTNIRVERENCCDELAISYTGDHIKYAKTLVKMQELSLSNPALAMNFSKKNSFFANRIKRILKMTQTRNFLKEKIITSVILVLMVMFFTKELSGIDNKSKNGLANNSQNKELMAELTQDSFPARKESIRIQKKTNDRDVKISMEDGQVTELEVNGKVIDKADYDKYQDIIDESKPNSLSNGNSRMFFFGDDDGGSFSFNFDGNMMNTDSIFKKFDFNRLQDLDNFHFDQGQMQEQMKKLQEQLGNLNFNFKGMDSLGFGFPNMQDFGFYQFKDGDLEQFPFHEDHEDPGIENDKTNRNFNDILGNALNRDGLLIPNQDNKVELTGKYLKINGEKQPNNIYQKYKRIFEEESGAELNKNSKLVFSYQGKESKRKYRVY